MAWITDNFIASIPDDPLEGVIYICKYITTDLRKELTPGNVWSVEAYPVFLEAYALFSSYVQVNDINDITLPPLSNDKSENMQKFDQFARGIISSYEHKLSDRKIEDYEKEFLAKLKGGFCYEFTEGDLKRVQELINDLRVSIKEFAGFEEEHRARLLKRLERLQSELHKKVSDVDRFWGLVGDAGVMLGKFGKDAKPMVDRIREIAGIVWRTQSTKEELPSGTVPPMLGHEPMEDKD